jgi:hypothetical protein
MRTAGSIAPTSGAKSTPTVSAGSRVCTLASDHRALDADECPALQREHEEEHATIVATARVPLGAAGTGRFERPVTSGMAGAIRPTEMEWDARSLLVCGRSKPKVESCFGSSSSRLARSCSRSCYPFMGTKSGDEQPEVLTGSGRWP